MIDHIENLKEYVKEGKVIQSYMNKDELSDFDRYVIQHDEDIEWAINEIEELTERVMRLENEKNM